jgi:hypothetical protein
MRALVNALRSFNMCAEPVAGVARLEDVVEGPDFT